MKNPLQSRIHCDSKNRKANGANDHEVRIPGFLIEAIILLPILWLGQISPDSARPVVTPDQKHEPNKSGAEEMN